MGYFSGSAILLYQAFNSEIADYAVREQKFEGAPGYNEKRMTWTKPNFLWMMFRSGWAKKSNQERILGIWLKLDAFHELLQLTRRTNSQNTSTKHEKIGSQGSVVLQWDPDHTPMGDHMKKRAIQIGIKGVPWWKTGERFEQILDLTPLVRNLREFATSKTGLYPSLFVPQEKIYVLPANIAKIAGADTAPEDLEEEASHLANNAEKLSQAAPAP